MKITRTRAALALAAAAVAVSATATGCSATNHDAPNPTVDIVLQWWRIETPPSVVTTFFACFGNHRHVPRPG